MKYFRLVTGIITTSLAISATGASAATSSYSAPTSVPMYRYSASSFIPESSPSYQPAPTDAVAYVRSRGIMTGYPSGSFAENNAVNRAEFANIVMTVYSRVTPPTYDIRLPFSDVSSTAWYSPSIVYAYGLGLMTGYPDNTFHPDGAVNVAEAAKVLSIVYQLDAQGGSDLWYEAYVRSLAGQHAIPRSIEGLFRPLTRGQLAEIIYRLDSGDTTRSSQTYDDIANTFGYSGQNISCVGPHRNLQVVAYSPTVDPVAGERISYRITIRNCSSLNQLVDLTADTDSQTSFINASDGGHWANGYQIAWDSLGVRRGNERTVILTVDISSRIQNGDRIDLSVHAEDQRGNRDTMNSHRIIGRDRRFFNDTFVPSRVRAGW